MVQVPFSVLTCTSFCLILSTIDGSLSHSLRKRSQNSIDQTNANINYTRILNFWKEHKREFALHGNHNEAVLVMGVTGTGKSTLVSALTGQPLNVTESLGYTKIVDGKGRIGTGSLSTTLVPEVMIDYDRNITYIDCAGFDDNRHVEYEMSAMYFQKILMNQIEKVKLILVINYEALTDTGVDFDLLLKHIGEFVKDVSKFHNGIGLVATKVENLYRLGLDGAIQLVNDNPEILGEIAAFLRRKKENYHKKSGGNDMYTMFENLVDVLLEKNGDSYSKIAVFRKPKTRGSLKDLPDTVSELNAIVKMITENLHYVKKDEGDFGITMSDSLKNNIDTIIEDIFKDVLTNRLHTIGNETLMHYMQMEKQYDDIDVLNEQLHHAYGLISAINNVDTPERLFQEFLNVANTLNISVSLTNLDVIADNIKALQFFTTVSDRDDSKHMNLLKEKTRSIGDLICVLKDFYDFLVKLHNQLTDYSSQTLKKDGRIKNISTAYVISENKVVQDIPDLESIVQAIGCKESYEKVKTFQLNQFQLKHLAAVFTLFQRELEFSCQTPSEPMIVKGYNVKITDVVRINCWAQANDVQILVLNKVYIDATIDKTGQEAQLSIFAPIWEVYAEQKIILDGKKGDPHEKTTAKSAFSYLESGAAGLPGLPGGSAGNFLGVGKQFRNLDNLEIRANGGEGGTGQHGGNGANGVSGERLPESFFQVTYYFADLKQYFIDHGFQHSISVRIFLLREKCYQRDRFRNGREIDRFCQSSSAPCPASYSYEVEVLNKPAKEPSDGGDGGAGGKGGYPGRIMLKSFGEPFNVKKVHNTGSTGPKGQGGHGGQGTTDKEKVKFNITVTLNHIQWKGTQWIPGVPVPAGKDGTAGGNTINQRDPVQITKSFYSAVTSFKEFVRMNLFKNIKESALKKLILDLENDDEIKEEYNTFAFVKEFKGLENQFLQLRNNIDLIPFYDSLLARIEEYTKSNNNPGDKKVLSYIYVAALTKLITLDKKSQVQTVVDLPKYLDTMKDSISKIDRSYHSRIVQQYQNDYQETLNKKIQEANNFIQNIIEPEINKLWEESDHQIRAMITELEQHKNSSRKAMEILEENRKTIRLMIELRCHLQVLTFATIALSFMGGIGSMVGIAAGSALMIAEGKISETSSSLAANKVHIMYPNLQMVSRVKDVINNKYKLTTTKLNEAMEKLNLYEGELDASESTKKRQINTLKTQLQEITFRKAEGFQELMQKMKDTDEVQKKMFTLTNSEKKVLEEKKELEKGIKDLKKERKYERRIRLLNDAQVIVNSVEIAYSFSRKLGYDQGIKQKINDQISEYADQLRAIESVEYLVYGALMPNLRMIDETMNVLKTSIRGSSHVKLDITKWQVRTSLKDVKVLLQKLTQKMSFELQSDLQSYMEKIDAGFSVLVDIYDRIDSYSDGVKQAAYMAHIESASIENLPVADPVLSKAVNDLKLMIHSNILSEKYEIALHAFKQHYFPFASKVFQGFQLASNLSLNDPETLRSHIIDTIQKMKNYIAENSATLHLYKKYSHVQAVFDSTRTSKPFYVWKYDLIKSKVQRLLNGSEIFVKADISKGLFYNAVKYNDIGINFMFHNKALQSDFESVLRDFKLTMTMIGNNYYRCGERYYSISFDDDITISYVLNRNSKGDWTNPNEIYTLIHSSHSFLSPYGLWSIKLEKATESVSFDHLSRYANEEIDLELIGQGYYIDQNPNFNFEVCDESLGKYYAVEDIVKVLF